MGVVTSKNGKRVNLKSKIVNSGDKTDASTKKNLKIVLVGLESSGKTSVLHYLTHKTAPTVSLECDFWLERDLLIVVT